MKGPPFPQIASRGPPRDNDPALTLLHRSNSHIKGALAIVDPSKEFAVMKLEPADALKLTH
jgi:hypothetical protein